MTDLGETPNFIVVIRSAEERTEEACIKLIEAQAKDASIELVKESPFKKALETCYKIGIASEKKWLITVDADMLLVPGAIDVLVEQAESMPDNYIQLQARICDKITNNVRKAGPRIYRVQFLERLLALSESLEDSIRPENRIITMMGEMGHPSRYISSVVSLHDFEQYYGDIYRKVVVHARKHADWVPEMIQFALQNKEHDTDYEIMLKAIYDGLLNTDEVSIDKSRYVENARKALEELNLTEKTDIINPDGILSLLRESFDKAVKMNQQTITYYDKPKTEPTVKEKLTGLYNEKGFVNGIKHGLGSMLLRIGNNLQKKSNF